MFLTLSLEMPCFKFHVTKLSGVIPRSLQMILELWVVVAPLILGSLQ